MKKRRMTIMLVLLVGCALFAYRHLTTVSPAELGQTVGAAYGDQNAKVIRVVRSQTEATFQPMYLITLQGHFHDGQRTATHLSFSALQNGKSIWAVTVSDD